MTLKEYAADTGAAIDEAPVHIDGENAVLELDLIVERPGNPRTTFDPIKLQELADDIAHNGVDMPILVRPLPASRLQETFADRRKGAPLPTHELVAGARRLRACRMVGRHTIPVHIKQLTDAQATERRLIENLQRQDLTELEEAEGYQRLIEETGIAKEDIAKKVKKSRATIYGRLKLLELSNAGRDALRRGDIDASKAQAIARIPDAKLQQKALDEAMRKNADGDRPSEREFKRWLRVNVMLKLSDARFKITDAALLPDAGSCKDCTKRTGANPDLFSDVDSPDVCTDPPCFHAKEAAHADQVVEKAKRKGMEVIQGKEAKELMPHHASSIQGHYPLDDEVREGLSERELKGNVKLFIDPHSNEPIEIVTMTVAQKAFDKARETKMKPAERKAEKKRDEEQERKQLERDYQTRWRAAAITEIHPRVQAGEICQFTAPLIRQIIRELAAVDQRCMSDDVAVALGVGCFDDELIDSTIRATDDNEVGFKLLLTLLHADCRAPSIYTNGTWTTDDTAPAIDELGKLLTIDVAAIKARVQAEIRAEREPKSPRAKGLAAPQGGSTKGQKKSKPAAQAQTTKGKPKLTREEASACIADALQKLDAEPGGGAAEEARSSETEAR